MKNGYDMHDTSSENKFRNNKSTVNSNHHDF